MKIHEIKGFILSLYLVEYKEGLLLLDGGTRVDIEKVENYITNTLQRSFSDLKLVLISHAHPDHSGGASFFQKRGIPIAGSDKNNLWYKGPSGFITYLIDIFLTLFVAKKTKQNPWLRNVIFKRKITYDYLLKDGDKIPGFADWEVKSTPGHTYYDFSFYHSISKTIYIADTIIKSKNRLLLPYPIASPKDYRESLEYYINLKPNQFLLAHYGIHKISTDSILILMKSIPIRPKLHRSSLIKIILRVQR